jgi:hypothetical protein
LKGILSSTLLVLSISLSATLNATQLEELKKCDKFIYNPDINKNESQFGYDSFLTAPMDKIYENAYNFGYCLGLKMEAGFTDAVKNYSVFIKS